MSEEAQEEVVEEASNDAAPPVDYSEKFSMMEQRFNPVGVQPTGQPVSKVVALSAGDEIEMYVYQTGAVRSALAGSKYTFLQVVAQRGVR